MLDEKEVQKIDFPTLLTILTFIRDLDLLKEQDDDGDEFIDAFVALGGGADKEGFVSKIDNSKRIADYLFRFCPTNNRVNLLKIYFYSFLFKIYDFFSPIITLNIKKTNYANRSYKEKMDSGISKHEIKNFFAKINLKKIKVIKTCKDGYYFQNET